MAAENNKVGIGKFILTMIYILIFPAVLLFLSGDWFWIEGWIFSIWFVALSWGAIFYLYRKDPELLAERYRKPGTGGEKRWDMYFLYIFFILFVVWFVIMPLDAKRFMWTANFPLWLKIIGGMALIGSFFFMFRSYTDNPFLSPLVRIQKERKQYVVSTGVYGFVRHPMYLGGILLFIGTPLLLGSIYGVLIGVLLSILIMIRIIGEEKVLIEGLEGYGDYKNKVKYRLVPYIW